MLIEKSVPGNVLGASLLIAGCCIGAGMLGLPVVTRIAGFTPSLIVFVFSWLFMTLAGLVLLEVSLWFPDETNISEMAKTHLGRWAEMLSFFLMVFLMYALMTAYSSGAGQLLADMSAGLLSPAEASLLFAAALFLGLILGTHTLDIFNRIFMLGLGATYAALVTIGLPQTNPSHLSFSNWHEALFITPIMIVSFGFNNLVPSLTRYLERDVNKIRLSIFLGSFIALFIYLVWQYVILGLITPEFVGGESVQMASQLLELAAPDLPYILAITEAFAFFAITTSFMTNALSLLDFMSDQVAGVKTVLKRAALALIVISPPVILGIIDPSLFLKALSFAGSFAAILLFGLLPALMAWRGRTRNPNAPYKVKGGYATLMFLIAGSIFVMVVSNFF